MRCSIYARFSSDLQRDTSIDDQISAARRHADTQGWTVLADHIYHDAALSGSSMERPGIRALLSAAGKHPRPFDVLLVDDSSRVSRDLADAVRFMQDLKFCGVRVLYLSQSIDSDHDQAETMIAVHGVVDSLYLRELGKKTKRGLAGQIERGFATGGTTYGYRTVAENDPSGKAINGSPALLGKRAEIVPAEARIIVRIFELYADGLGSGRIIERLNRDGVRTRRGTRWKDGAVKRLLANEKYRGLLIWGQTTCDRRPGTKQQVKRVRPRAEWSTQERPELRIVSGDLWNRVQARRADVRGTLPADNGRTLMRGRNAALHSRNIFAGFLRCGTCSGAIATVTNGHGSPRYGCLRSWRDGRPACSNRLTIRAKIADAYLLAGLRAELLAPITLEYIIGQTTAALNARLNERPRVLAEIQTARAQTLRRLERLVTAIENGAPPAAINARLTEQQTELVRIDAALIDLAEPDEKRIAIMPGTVRRELDGFAELLAESPERAKMEFRRLGLSVRMDPTEADPRPFYRASVEVALPELAGLRDLRAADFTARTTPLGGIRPNNYQVFTPIPEQKPYLSATGRSHPRAGR